MSEENMSSHEGAPDPIEGIGDPVKLAVEGADGFLGAPWSRRTFLKAAALGTAAAAVWQKGPGLSLNPAAAFANDLSGNPCTANDVQIIGNGIVTNEPCECTDGGTFTAIVQFTVRNITATGRYCISLHLSDGRDILLKTGIDGLSGTSTAAPKTDTVMYGQLLNFPCNAETVCFGQAGVTTGKCAPLTCSTVAWSTSPGSASCTTPDLHPPPGQCRHQQICITGFGAGLTCSGDGSCDVPCGGSLTLTATVAGGTSPYVYELTGPGGYDVLYPTSGTTTATSHDFTGLTAAGTYTVTITDAAGCSRTATATLTATAITASINASTPGCDGVITFSASATTGQTGCTPTWTIDGNGLGTFTNDNATLVVANTDGTIDVRLLGDTCHTIAVDLACGSCSGQASTTVNWGCVSPTSGCTA
jgi:hypothetical protein